MSCKSDQHSNSKQEKYKAIAEEKYGDPVTYTPSENGNFILCIHNETGSVKQPQNRISYFVYDLNEDQIIHEETFGPGTIQWYDEDELEIFYLPGVMPENKTKEDFTYLLNVKTKDKVKKSDRN